MKTYFKDFSIGDYDSITKDRDLIEVINFRQERFQRTERYRELNDKFEAILKELETLTPENKQSLNSISDIVCNLECACYDAAYNDGMSDLMTAITFNKIGLTKAEYVGDREGRLS